MVYRRRARRRPAIVLTNQQAKGLFGDLVKGAAKSLTPLIKKEVKKALPKLGKFVGKKALKAGRKTKLGKKLGIGIVVPGGGLKLAGQGPVLRRKRKKKALNARGKQVRRRRRKPGARIIMI